MENNQDFEKDQEEFTQQELEQEVLWMRALLELEEKEIPLPESLRSEHLLEKIRDAAARDSSMDLSGRVPCFMRNRLHAQTPPKMRQFTTIRSMDG